MWTHSADVTLLITLYSYVIQDENIEIRNKVNCGGGDDDDYFVMMIIMMK